MNQWHRVDELYARALEVSVEDRRAFVERASKGDEPLFKELTSLLAMEEPARGFLETSALELTTHSSVCDADSAPPEGFLTRLFARLTRAGNALDPGLLVRTPRGHARHVPLGSEPVTLGRTEGNTLAFPDDDGLSRRHLTIELEEEAWTLSDAGSRNGTQVNGIRLKGRRRLQPGDEILASCVSITFLGSRNQ